MEIYIVAHGLASKATSVLFLRNNNVQARSKSEFLVLQINTVYFCQNSIRYLGPIIWNSLPLTLRNVKILFLDLSLRLKFRNQQISPLGYAKTILILAL